MDYYQKYLKYKNKYIDYKNQIGGKIIEKYSRKDFKPLCFSQGFKQHTGECWNDSIQQFFCFQDEIKEQVQRRLLFLSIDEIIELAEMWGRKEYLPLLLKENKDKYDEIIIKLKKYLITMQERFRLYYERELKIGRFKEEQLLIPSQVILKKPLKIPTIPTIGILQKQKSIDLGTTSAILGLECNLNTTKTMGGNIGDINLIIILLSYALLDTKTLILNKKDVSDINSDDILNMLSIYNIIPKHATLFYKCNDKEQYFDDNLAHKHIPFKYIKYFNDNILSLKEDFLHFKYNNSTDTIDFYIIKYDAYDIENLLYPRIYKIDENTNKTEILTDDPNYKIRRGYVKMLTKFISYIIIKYNSSNIYDEKIRMNNYLLFEMQLLTKDETKENTIILNNIKRYIPVIDIDIDIKTPIYNNKLLTIFINRNDIEMVQLILNNNANPNIFIDNHNYKGFGPNSLPLLAYTYISFNNDKEYKMTKLLLRYIGFEKKDDFGNTILHLICQIKAMGNLVKLIIDFLKEKLWENNDIKNYINQKNSMGESPYDIAVYNKDNYIKKLFDKIISETI